MITVIKGNSEDFREWLESKGFTYGATWPKKDYGECLIIDDERQSYIVEKDIDQFLELVKKLKEMGKFIKYQIYTQLEFKKEIGE